MRRSHEIQLVKQCNAISFFFHNHDNNYDENYKNNIMVFFERKIKLILCYNIKQMYILNFLFIWLKLLLYLWVGRGVYIFFYHLQTCLRRVDLTWTLFIHLNGRRRYEDDFWGWIFERVFLYRGGNSVRLPPNEIICVNFVVSLYVLWYG